MRMIAILIAAAVLGAGCATKIIAPYQVTSAPSGAPVEVNGIHMGETPTQIQLGTSKHWVGLCVAPGGWAYGNETYNVTAYPPQMLQNPFDHKRKQFVHKRRCRAEPCSLT